jgi:Ca-activated chloride channel family protein
MLAQLPKPVTFAIVGAIGCLIAAICIGEPLHILLEPDAPPTAESQQVDVMFVLDATASMQYAIDGTKSGIQTFADELQNENLDARVGLVAFRDRVWQPPQLDICFVLDVTHSMQDEIDGVRDGIGDFATSLETAGLDTQIGLVAFRDRLYTPPKVDISFVLDVSSSMSGEIRGVRDGIESFASSLEGTGLDVQIGLVAFCNSGSANAIETLAFKNGFFTKDFADFKSKVSRLNAFGGGIDESSYLGLYTAVNQRYRNNSERILILISDEPPKIPDANIRDTAHMVSILKELDDAKLYCVVNSELQDEFRPLAAGIPQKFFSLSANGRRVDFSQILPAVVGQITADVGGSKDSNTGASTDQDMQILEFKSGNFTNNYTDFKQQVAGLRASGGGDRPESVYDALWEASKLQFRKGSDKLLVLITDDEPLIPDASVKSIVEMSNVLKTIDKGQLYCVIDRQFDSNYMQFNDVIPTKLYSLTNSSGRVSFADILPQVATQIATDLGDSSDSSDKGGATRNVFSADQLEPVVLDFNGWNFTSDPTKFQSQLASIEAVGGGDIPESSLDALALASGLDFRVDAEKVLVLITDAPPRIPDKDNADASETAKALKAAGISQFHVVTMTEFEQHYRAIQTTSGIDGKFFSLAAAATGSDGFDAILPDVGEAIAVASVKGLQSGVAYAEDQTALLLTLVGLWTGVLSCGICLTLIAAQNASLHRQILSVPEALKGGGGSLLTGIISGIVGQLLFQYALGTNDSSQPLEDGAYAREVISRICAWVMLGGMLGGTMAFFVPNLKWHTAAIGGAIGGGIGAGGYLLASGLGYSLGRILGAATLGLLIGLMVALSEIVSRTYWLEVSYGGTEKTMVNLGATPVTVGNDRSCTVWISSGPPVKYSYSMEADTVFCNDVAASQSRSVRANDTNSINQITLTVRAASVEAAPHILPRTNVAPPPPKKPGPHRTTEIPSQPPNQPPNQPVSPPTPDRPRAGSRPLPPPPQKPPLPTGAKSPPTPRQPKSQAARKSAPPPPPPRKK